MTVFCFIYISYVYARHARAGEYQVSSFIVKHCCGQSINLLLFLQKQNLATAIYLFIETLYCTADPAPHNIFMVTGQPCLFYTPVYLLSLELLEVAQCRLCLHHWST